MHLNNLVKLGEEDLVKDVDLKYILRCILRLSTTDILIYKALLSSNPEDPPTVAELASVVGKSRSTVEKSLIKLIQLGLATRRAVLTRRGGYTFVYYPVPVNEVKDRLTTLLNAYYQVSKDLIKGASIDELIKSIEESGVDTNP